MINTVRSLYINLAHHIFSLTPMPLNNYFIRCYENMGKPHIERDSIWQVYLNMLHTIHQYTDLPELLTFLDSEPEWNDANDSVKGFEYIARQKDLPDNEDEYLSGVNNGHGLCKSISTVISCLILVHRA